MTTNMKEIQFASASYEEWQEQATKALKGKPFESLLTKTIEGITLEPLYTEATLIDKLGEQLEKQVATIRTMKATDSFEIAQQIYGDSAEQFLTNLQDSLARGNEVLTIDSRVAFEWDTAILTSLADFMTEYTFKLIVENSNDPLMQVFTKIAADKKHAVTGYIVSRESLELADFPNVRTAHSNTVKYHNNGANAVQELAIALAQASDLAKKATSYEDVAQKFFVSFAIDTQFFMEIAKIRAFKVLWKAFSKGLGAEAIAVPIVAETSVRSFSKLDVYVNLLRAGNEAFAGIIGGVDVFTVHPHDVLTKPTEQSIRIARNVLLVANEESHVLNVTDPSGGSYFIESLTADLVKEAWQLFIQIEAAGGLEAYRIDTKIEDVYQTRIKQIETRKASLIGTNIYANPADSMAPESNVQFVDVKRLAIPFEKLRESYAQQNAKMAILTFGELKNFKARADFVAGFFATAGITIEQSGAISTIEEAERWLKTTDYDYIVVAAMDEDAKTVVPALLKVKQEKQLLDVAGKFKEEEQAWQADGLNGFIFAGQNMIQKLNAVMASLKEVQG
ncbi:methylmalonyl-CoA mutase family protein [Metasolibacillus sp.]|uniref:methylmalonyl-CoA mutase family protein n=1 Tax=Metasolibacillus sp. TaxID=2703680 RepID=UPI0025E67DF3|nr:methylmalonyl-CoA mutase family protein [Metasolibacillus sp.]MCT6922972.1 methylmalonyl-CoA mutase family protein [Metasolibacillus sp.]MCT6939210.1 methylmalonyl-CoA mutase family protein [Metasolibacillus sp.]